MQVILLVKVTNLGLVGEQVKVKKGYARNYLFPKEKAVLATKKNLEYFENIHNELEIKNTNQRFADKELFIKIKKLHSITILSKVSNKGKLFGSIGTKEIANAINNHTGITITKNRVRLPTGILRYTGNYEVFIHIYGKNFTKLNVIIIPEN